MIKTKQTNAISKHILRAMGGGGGDIHLRPHATPQFARNRVFGLSAHPLGKWQLRIRLTITLALRGAKTQKQSKLRDAEKLHKSVEPMNGLVFSALQMIVGGEKFERNVTVIQIKFN